MKNLTLFVLTYVYAVMAFAVPSWKDLASGEHSFKTLGPGFYQEVPVREIPKNRIQLSFINRRLVERLGLALPQDPVAAEKMLTDLFGWEVDPTKSSPKKWFASHYLDGSKKGPGEAMGDGRALWTGELKLETKDGKILYIDGIQKGVGATPFAWLKNPGHSDGAQNTGELIRSGIKSIADMDNQLDSTGDILGFTMTNDDGSKRSMTLRVGRQTRPAHLAFHADSVTNEAKMMDYIARRDLGLPLDAPVTTEVFNRWCMQFAKNNAEDTARVFTLNAFFEQPTLGNKTTSGGSIDLNGRQYLDAFHSNLGHLYMRLKVEDMVDYQKSYIGLILNFLRKANYAPALALPELRQKMDLIFDRTFDAAGARLQLHRLGLSEKDIQLLSPPLRQKFFKATTDLMYAKADRKANLVFGNDNVTPAAYDTRKILKGTMEAMHLPTPLEREAAMDKLYKVDRAWGPANLIQAHRDRWIKYETVVGEIIHVLGGVKSEWIHNAAVRTNADRYDSSTDGLWDKWAEPLMRLAESGKSNWQEISGFMENAADSLIDQDLIQRRAGMLLPRVGAKAGALMCRDLFENAG